MAISVKIYGMSLWIATPSARNDRHKFFILHSLHHNAHNKKTGLQQIKQLLSPVHTLVRIQNPGIKKPCPCTVPVIIYS